MPRPAAPTADRTRLRGLALVGVAAGAWLLAAPTALHLPAAYPDAAAALNCLVVGALVVGGSGLHALQWTIGRAGSRLSLVLGLWLAASPLVFGYPHDGAEGRTETWVSVVTGLVIVAGASLSLAGSHPSAEVAAAPASDAGQHAPARPVLWPEPAHGQPLVPFVPAPDRQDGELRARRDLPWAWAAVGTITAGCVLIGVAFVLISWSLGIAGVVVVALGAVLAVKVRILADTTVGRAPTGP